MSNLQVGITESNQSIIYICALISHEFYYLTSNVLNIKKEDMDT